MAAHNVPYSPPNAPTIQDITVNNRFVFANEDDGIFYFDMQLPRRSVANLYQLQFRARDDSRYRRRRPNEDQVPYDLELDLQRSGPLRKLMHWGSSHGEVWDGVVGSAVYFHLMRIARNYSLRFDTCRDLYTFLATFQEFQSPVNVAECFDSIWDIRVDDFTSGTYTVQTAHLLQRCRFLTRLRLGYCPTCHEESAPARTMEAWRNVRMFYGALGNNVPQGEILEFWERPLPDRCERCSRRGAVWRHRESDRWGATGDVPVMHRANPNEVFPLPIHTLAWSMMERVRREEYRIIAPWRTREYHGMDPEGLEWVWFEDETLFEDPDLVEEDEDEEEDSDDEQTEDGTPTPPPPPPPVRNTRYDLRPRW